RVAFFVFYVIFTFFRKQNQFLKNVVNNAKRRVKSANRRKYTPLLVVDATGIEPVIFFIKSPKIRGFQICVLHIVLHT
ncbi:MAG: hypothetical protein IJ401_03370, partial [Oscillospiraceae bacterium]|nr:hypothetical protein [Oscillospiraceae bacterium]